MVDKKKSKIEVTYANGFLVGRLADIDTSNGMEQTAAGVDVRVRVENIVMYSAAEPGVVLIMVSGIPTEQEGAAVPVIGTVKGVDDVIKRDRIGIQ